MAVASAPGAGASLWPSSGTEATSLTSFRPYEDFPTTVTRPRASKPTVANVAATTPKKTAPVQRFPSPSSSQTGKGVVIRHPPVSRKEQQQQQQQQPQSRVRTLQSQSSTTSMSGASAVGSSVAVLQSRRSIVEEQIDKIISSNSLTESIDDHWMPDKLCHECSECGIRFTLFVRRHHCRVCGRIYCHSCSNHTIPGHLFRPGLTGNVRVCLACEQIFYEVVVARQSQDTSTMTALPVPASRSSLISTSDSLCPSSLDPETSSIASTSTFTSSIIQNRIPWDESESDLLNSPSRAPSQGIEFDNPTPHRHPSASLQAPNEERILALAEDEVEYRLQEIWQRFLDKVTGPLPQTHRHRFRNFPNSYSAQQIVDWLLHNNMAQNREMAVNIGQALLHTKCLKVVSPHDQQFKDMKDLILEVGEAGQLTFSTSPTVADAPNWFLSNDDEDSSTANGQSSRVSLHEANIDLEAGLATFHRKKLNFPKLEKPIPEEPATTIPKIIKTTVEEAQEEDEESSTLPVPPLSDDQDLRKTSVPGQYIFPPALSLNAPSSIDFTATGLSFSILDTDAVNAAMSMTGLSKASQATKQFEETSVYHEIRRQHLIDHEKHLDAFLMQQLKTIGLSLQWLDTIKPLILTASNNISTDVTADDYMDICVYCKVKKIPGGRMSSCSFIHGVVFSKHVTHKKMNMSLRNPRILLLKCAFEFQRKENQLSSFDTLLSQEQEYLRNLVERVKRFKPSIIFVQKSVSRFALEILHHCGIVVVVNIKPSVMARIARSTQADLISNLDQLYFDVKLGTCGHFYVRTYTLPDGIRKTLIYLDECDPKLGGVMLLQGGTKKVLKRVKKVALFGAQVAYNMKLESAYLSDLLVTPSCSRVDYPDCNDYSTPPSTPTQTLYHFSLSLLNEERVNGMAPSLEREEEVLASVRSQVDEEKLEPLEEVETSTPQEKEILPDEEEREPSIVYYEEIIRMKESAVQNEETSDAVEQCSIVRPLTSEVVFQNILSYHLISTSPYMTYSVPYLQTEQGLQADVRRYLPFSIYWSYWFQPKANLYVANSARYDTSVAVEVIDSNPSLEDSPARHSYKSVSSHPFTRSTFLFSGENSKKEYQAALADFRARACHPDELDCFFFPSAQRSANVYQHLNEIFASSRDFEMQAGNLNNCELLELNQESAPNDESEKPKVEQQRNRKTSLTALAQPQERLGVHQIEPGHEEEGKEETDNEPSHPRLSHVLEHAHSPEPRGPLLTGEEPGRNSGEWGFLMDDNILPNSEQLDCLDPSNHQFLSLVFSSTCNDNQLQKQLYPCVLPCIIPMQYYGRNDIPLGEFLHRYCFRTAYTCQSCTVDMDKHQRHFVHGKQEVRISMQQLLAPIPGGDKNIFTWSTCLKCSHSTPLLPLSKESLIFSFGKFLELKFYGSSYVAYDFQEGQDEDSVAPVCTHPINTCYVQYFCFCDKVAVFEPVPINILEVRIPPQHVSIETASNIMWHHDYPAEIKKLGQIVEGVFWRIIQYLNLFNFEPVQSKVLDSLARAQAMRESYRIKVKRLKDLCAPSGLFPGTGRNTAADDDDVYTNVFCVQDSVADLKRLIAEAVFCFNLELDEIDREIRDVHVQTRKEGLSKDHAQQPVSSEDYTPISSAHTSPVLKPKSTDRLQINAVTSSPTLKKKRTLTPPSFLSQSIECDVSKRKSHKRQLSDSSALTKSLQTPEVMEQVDGEVNDISRDNAGDGLIMRRHSAELTEIESFQPLGVTVTHSSNGSVAKAGSTFSSTGNINSAHSSTGNIKSALSSTGNVAAAAAEAGNTDTIDEDSSQERQHELLSAFRRDGFQSEYMQSMQLQIEDVEFLSKLRGKEIAEDGPKFYQIQGSPARVMIPESLEAIDVTKAMKGPSPRRNPNVKIDDIDSGLVPKSTEKKQYPDKLTALLAKPFQKLPSPFGLTEHHLIRGNLRFHVSVYEAEPTSIIAFVLCSREYANELKCVQEERKKGLTESTAVPVPSVFPEGDTMANGPTTGKASGFRNIKNAFSDWVKNRQANSTTSPSSDDQLSIDIPYLEESEENELFASIKWSSTPDSSNSKFSSSHENRNISLEFTDETTKFFCKVYYAEEFRKLREYIYPDGEERFIRSLARCVKYEAKGGKTRAMFLKTFEDRLIMKQVQMVEITSFIETAPQYFQHVTEAIKNERPLVLAKILGAYSIGFRNSKTNRSKRHHVIIMENLLYGHHCAKVFDLKGSMRGRYVTQNPKRSEVTGEVLMDENFLEYIYNQPVYVWPHSKAVLMQAILADTQFLATNSIMDYSLLTGLDEEKGELVVGIIDFVRPFTLDKLLEMFIKKAGRSVLPTVVYPELYRKRFIEAMDRYFTAVPDKWTGLGTDVKMNLAL